METLLVHAAVAAGVPARGSPRASARPASSCAADERAAGPHARTRGRPTAADWDAEYLDYILAVRVVPSLDEAVAHIRRHGSGLAEAIVTRDLAARAPLHAEVDAGAVLVNASTRLVDGSQFGMGAEMGISTSQAPRARPGRRARADHDQVRGDGRRAAPGVTVPGASI